MSQYPKRLIDELGEGDARRLLELARADEPPAKMVAAAILTASKSTSAGDKAPESSVRVAGSNSRRRNIALIAGALVIGAAAIIATTRDESRAASASASMSESESEGESEGESATRNEAAGEPLAVNAKVDEPAVLATAEGTSVLATAEGTSILATAEGTSVTALPDAPARRAAAPAAKSAAETADLLREANRLRARGQWADAAATYRKVINLGPDSAEAYPADVALGNLELQQGRPLPALARYEHALGKHPNGALSEEARWGKARALRAAGRTAEERAALEDFRKRHPDSPLAPVAAQRLADLGN